MNRHLILTAAALLLASGAAPAESLPLQSVNKANTIIDAAIEAHGGAAALDALRTVVQKQDFVTWATGQSRRPGPPWDRAEVSNFNAIDLENEIFVNHNAGEGGGFVFDQGVIINGENSWQLNHFSGSAAPMAEPDYATQSGPFIRVTAPLLIKQLQARRQATRQDMLDRGTKHHSMAELADELEGLSAEVHFGAGRHSTSIGARCMADDLHRILAVNLNASKAVPKDKPAVNRLVGLQLTDVKKNDPNRPAHYTFNVREGILEVNPPGASNEQFVINTDSMTWKGLVLGKIAPEAAVDDGKVVISGGTPESFYAFMDLFE
mgnify:CR=1 FL=1